MQSTKFILILFSLVIISNCGDKVRVDSHSAIQWVSNLDSALTIASNSNKILMIDFMAEWCPPCQKMDKETFINVNIIKKSNEFIPVRIDIEKQQDVANEYNGNARKYGGIGIPNILFMDKEKKVIHQIVGFHDVEKLTEVMDSILMQYK